MSGFPPWLCCGRDWLQVILVLAAVLGLENADKGTVSALSDQLEQAFGLEHPDIGLLVAVTAFMGAAGALPMGILADRMKRKSILVVPSCPGPQRWC